MKKIVLLITLCATLFGALPFTLENLKDLRIFFVNKTDYIDKKQKAEIQGMIEEKLKSAGFTMNRVDSSTFMIKIESTKIDKTYIVNVQIGVGEEVITRRKDKVETLAFTYMANDFMESDEPYDETLESINFLMDEFLELYKEDME